MADFDVVLYKKLEEDKLAMPSDLNLMRFKNNAIAYLGGSDILQKYIKEYGANGYAHMQIIKGFVQSAHFGLDFLNNEAYLIPYKEKLDGAMFSTPSMVSSMERPISNSSSADSHNITYQINGVSVPTDAENMTIKQFAQAFGTLSVFPS